MGDFTGQVVLIAGALGTLGVGIAETLRAKGATVLIAPGRACPPDLIALYAGFAPVDGAIGDADDLAPICEAIVARHGRLDLVVFCNGSDLPQSMEAVPVLNTPSKPRPLLGRLRAMVMAIL
jgi:NAD(P)-dependent dehydrogenase (short-subunit alcohol dehydrogenase family)